MGEKIIISKSKKTKKKILIDTVKNLLTRIVHFENGIKLL